MALTRDMILASRQAQRLSADAEFMAVLARIERTATEQAVQNPVPEQREACRQLALTVMCIRQEIAADADLEAAEQSREHLARGME